MENKENILTPELIEKARQTKSVEELFALAKENGITISEEEAKDYFEQLHKTGELSDDELDNVSGGGCYYKDGRLVVTVSYFCKRYVCRVCNEPRTTQVTSVWNPGYEIHICDTTCSGCKYLTRKGLRMLCNHPDNYKR